MPSITAAEMSGHKNADAEFGFDNPQFTLDLTAGEPSWHLRVGNKTAPGDRFMSAWSARTARYVTDAGWLQILPRNRPTTGATRRWWTAGNCRGLDCHHQRRQGHRTAARRDEPSLADDPAVAGARRQHRIIDRAAAVAHRARFRNLSRDDPKPI